MADFKGMNEAHTRILPSVEETYLVTDTPSNYSSHALHIILKTPVLKPVGSDMLWILYTESILHSPELKFLHFPFVIAIALDHYKCTQSLSGVERILPKS